MPAGPSKLTVPTDLVPTPLIFTSTPSPYSACRTRWPGSKRGSAPGLPACGIAQVARSVARSPARSRRFRPGPRSGPAAPSSDCDSSVSSVRPSGR